MSADIKPYAKRAVEVIDAYLAFQMSADEAGAALDEVYERMDGQSIRTKDDIYSDREQSIASDIYLISGNGVARRTDVELRRYRDEIAFAIGEPVTGYVYEAEQNIWDEEDPLPSLIDIDSVPFFSGGANVTADMCHCALFFDEMNVPDIEDLQIYIEYAFNCMLAKGKNITSLNVHYRRFGQSVLVINIWEEAGIFRGHVSRMDEPALNASDRLYDTYTPEEIATMENYPSEFDILNPLYEFSSMDDLDRAMAIAASFAGMQ